MPCGECGCIHASFEFVKNLTKQGNIFLYLIEGVDTRRQPTENLQHNSGSTFTLINCQWSLKVSPRTPHTPYII